jgi:type II secretory ATPase GspE/PulE/Tfp pilus assembly ATPase PilB-like protein
MNDVSSYLSYLLNEAYVRRASDIHLEPTDEGLHIRMRIDGRLISFDKREEAWGPPLISRIKLLAGLDIGERRLPQDGSFSYQVREFLIDVRISTLPLIYGEKIVMRLLSRQLPYTDLSSLGLDSSQSQEIHKMINASHGMILATGPTGSGKTTTLYTLLQEIRRQDRNIIALEDPVEYHVSGVNQVQVNVKAGLTFSAGLRASLRQDPDVIFVGEIRDQETAEIAIRAALSGHMVLSTLHTKDAVSAITRLLDMGVEPYLITSAVTGVIAQRLIRKICPCGTNSDKPCQQCLNTGYFGRQAVFEVLAIREDLHPYILHHAAPAEIRHYLRNKGFRSLNVNLKEKVKQGITTITEFQRVLIADAE